MSILANHFPEVLAELNADPDRPETPEATEEEITAPGEAAGEPLRDGRSARKPRPRPRRTVRVLAPATPVNPSTFIEVTVQAGLRVQTFWYWVSTVASDFGRAFTFEPSAATPPEERNVYHVCLNGKQSTCECKGFLRWGSECKHLGAARRLVELGRP
jgi:hypothetical protein